MKIAGIGIKESAKDKFTYEQLFKQAKESLEWLRVKDADKKIDAELKKHGYKPAKTTTNKTKTTKQK